MNENEFLEFTFKYKHQILYSGIFKKSKCEGKNCNKLVSIGLPYCDTHLISKLNVTIKEVKGKGKGVFAINNKKTIDNVVFPKNSTVLPFHGDYFDNLNPYGKSTGPYCAKIKQFNQKNEHKYIDAAFYRHISSLVNCSDKYNKANVTLEVVGDKIFFKACKDINNA